MEFLKKLVKEFDDQCASECKRLGVEQGPMPGEAELDAMTRARASEQVLAAFQKVDADNDGTISREQLAEALETIGFPKTKAARAFEEADANRDGKLDYEEFVAWVFAEDVPSLVGQSLSVKRESSQSFVHQARDAIKDLNKRHIYELTRLRKIPAGIDKVCIATCLILFGKLGRRDFKSCQMAMANPALFLKQLDTFDPSSITNESLIAVNQIIEGSAEMFTIEVMKRKSTTAAAFVGWVLAMKAFAEVEGTIASRSAM